jgi:hypothetical protein
MFPFFHKKHIAHVKNQDVQKIIVHVTNNQINVINHVSVFNVSINYLYQKLLHLPLGQFNIFL